MEISGELLVSSSSGLCCLPPCRWCPLKLLIAKERAERRAPSPSKVSPYRSSGNASTGASRVLTAVDPTSKERSESIADRAGATATNTGPQVPKAGGGCGDAELGPLRRCSEADDETMRAGGRSVRRTGDVGWKGDGRTRAVSEQGCTSPTGAGVGDAHAPFRLNDCLAPREDGGVGDCSKLSILDRMSSKVLSITGSPPPQSTRAAKARNDEPCLRRDPKSIA